MIVAGIDEAGRGCVLGPLVVAGVCIESTRLGELEELGVKDSKALTADLRESLYCEIVDRCLSVRLSLAQPQEIDRYVRKGRKYRRLNYMEAVHMARVIDALGADEVYIDAPDTNPPRFTRELTELLTTAPRVVAEHKADVNYVVVSAASIVAKVERDREVAKLREVHGEFGSGYPSDQETIAFLEGWVEREGSLPDFSRKSWKTWERILNPVLG